ncbi:MAG: hypothetical protein SGI83_03655 [Bacteroidota bacterium]|nr:hypothetical protein [Bacteroidota bacterium]
MQKKFSRIDKTFFKASKLDLEGNADYKFWFDKTIEERLAAAIIMTSVSFREPDFMNQLVDRTLFSARKQPA